MPWHFSELDQAPRKAAERMGESTQAVMEDMLGHLAEQLDSMAPRGRVRLSGRGREGRRALGPPHVLRKCGRPRYLTSEREQLPTGCRSSPDCQASATGIGLASRDIGTTAMPGNTVDAVT